MKKLLILIVASALYFHFYPNEKLNAQEQTYVAEITRSRKQVKSFYQSHCLDKKRTTKLHRDNLIKVCQTISEYSSLL